MNEIPGQVLSWAGGATIGAFFFAGLWWTVRKGASSQYSALWFFASLMLRMCIALAGFYLVSAGHWDRMLLCLTGFVMARVAVTWLTRPPENNQIELTRGAGHAS